MKYYSEYLKRNRVHVNYIDSSNELSDIRNLIQEISKKGFKKIEYIDSVDYLIEKRIQNNAKENNLELFKYQSQLFINENEDLADFFKPEKKKFFQTTFYINQRKKLNILMQNDNSPVGGQWSFDSENRKKYPKGLNPPKIHFPKQSKFYQNAIKYVENNFSENYGNIDLPFPYPNNHEDAEFWLDDFLKNRFKEFGTYEDAIVSSELLLNHSLLSPLLNVGLISPRTVVEKIINFYKKNNTPINSVEGLIRQIIGWREFIRGIYLSKGSQERTTNFWNFSRKIPKSFYTGKTGIDPIDITIRKVNDTGYCHHIERLMVLGNFMVLCEFDPDEVYKWFMEMFIDSYDWVMVPNVYGMSQFSDGGLMSTKPYISGSNYLFKMSDYKKGDWQLIWDALFWRFIDTQREFFRKNPRMRMLVSTFDRMNDEKRINLIEKAENYLNKLN
tara:strand:- start:44884 stop:46215 length:1332 start_codon:yes stop_codon:yes gene_type:complete